MKIAVLLGGKSKEREGSLISGKRVIKALKELNNEIIEIDPKYDNIFDKLKSIDIVFNALHGEFGEDGCIQGFLDTLNIKYTGCGVLPSAIGMNKIIFKNYITLFGYLTPQYMSININNYNISDIITYIGFPFLIKPVYGGGSLGINIIREDFSGREIEELITETYKNFGDIFIEKYINGFFITSSIIQKNGEPVALPLLKVIPNNGFYDYHTKHSTGNAQYIIPADIAGNIYLEIQNISLDIFSKLNCRGAIRIDYILENDNIYILEINTSPGLSENGNLPMAASAYGISYEELIKNIVSSTLF